MQGLAGQMPVDVQALWRLWFAQRGETVRVRLAEHYAPFARKLAARIYGRRIARELEFGDFAQFAYVGLIEAIDRYDPNRGAQFETYAGYRIEGAVLNGIQSLSEKQRQISARRRTLDDRTTSLAGIGLAEALPDAGPSANDAMKHLAEVAVGLALGFMLEDFSVQSAASIDPATGTVLHRPEPTMPDNAYSRIEAQQLKQRIAALVQQLPDQERKVIYRHYFQRQKFEEVADILQLTKGRVSQLHRNALSKLRQMLHEQRVMLTL
jgi:RNA polymerase sigma factor FliA